MNRRELLQALALSTALVPEARAAPTPPPEEHTVFLVGDGVPRSPAQWTARLAGLLTPGSELEDRYQSGGVVTELERRFAALLGKQEALFLPTGTLANQLAMRVLCGEKRRALVPYESHLYRDESDAAQLLSGLNLVPLAPGRVGPTPEEVIAAVETSLQPPFPVPVGALCVESPVRRVQGRMMDLESVRALSTFARSKGIRLHLDGARLLLAWARPGFDVRAYAALFDTVYVSLYKYLDAPFGAVLAGDPETIARVRELRHVFGGGLAHAWPAAVMALHSLEGFPARLGEAMAAAERLFSALEKAGGFKVGRLEQGTNLFTLELAPERQVGLAARMKSAGVFMAAPRDNQTVLSVNETLLRRDTAFLVRAFLGG
jgi:threonine aldolase